MVTPRRILAILIVLGLQLPAGAGVLYKSVDSNGRITFSDVPPDGAVTVQRIATSESGKGAVGVTDEGSSPVYLALAEMSNEAVARASAQLDIAEHAYALARQQVNGDHDPLSLVGHSRARADRQRLEFYNRDVREARKALMRALQNRSLWAQRPVA